MRLNSSPICFNHPIQLLGRSQMKLQPNSMNRHLKANLLVSTTKRLNWVARLVKSNPTPKSPRKASPPFAARPASLTL